MTAKRSRTYMARSDAPLIRDRLARSTDRNGHTTTYLRDARGNLIGEERPDGGKVSHAVAANGDRMSATDGNGGLTRYGYDPAGNLLSTTTPEGGKTVLNEPARPADTPNRLIPNNLLLR